MSKEQCVGIDVSAKSLAVARRDRRGGVRVVEHKNTAVGHRALCRSLSAQSARVCLEATGIYHLDVALALGSTAGVEVMVVNPRASHNFARALMKRGKTDASDAEVLLVHAERMPWQKWSAPSAACFELRTLCRHTVSLRQQLAAERARMARATATASISAWVRDDIARGIKQFENRINGLDAAALDLIASDAGLAKQLELMRTIPGIAATSGVQLLSELCVLPSDMTARQWVAHAGLDPRQHQSGTSIDKRPRISRAGNRYVRRALYMPALVAVRHSPQVQAFYEQLLGRGKEKMQAVVAVMRKLLHAVWGMLRSGTAWDGARFYRVPAPAEVAASESRSPEPPAERRPPITHASSKPPRGAAGKGVGKLAYRRDGADDPMPTCSLPLPAVSTAAG